MTIDLVDMNENPLVVVEYDPPGSSHSKGRNSEVNSSQHVHEHGFYHAQEGQATILSHYRQ